jgi:small subunit ribosomal protein S13
MARIAGVNLPREKRVEIGLTYIFGIGRSTSQSVLNSLEIDRDTKVRDLTEEEVSKLRGYIDQNLMVEGDLRRDRSQNIKRLMEIGCYRGLRHRRGLPVHECAHPQGAEEDRRQAAQEVGLRVRTPRPRKERGTRIAPCPPSHRGA